MRIRGLLLAIPVALAADVSDARAQFFGFGDALSEADMLYLAGQPQRSLERLQDHLATDSLDHGALWRAARAAIVIGIEQEQNEVQNEWLDPALAWSRRAAELDSLDVDALYWRGVAAGRRAMNSGPGHAAELGQEVYEDAHAILAIDSLHAGAHNLLGKLNFEVMSMSRIKRFVARTFMSQSSLDDTSWEQAEFHLAMAAEHGPDLVLFHYDLAELHRKRGRPEEAAVSYVRTIATPSVHPTDRRLKAQAREALAEWGITVDENGAVVDTGEAADPLVRAIEVASGR